MDRVYILVKATPEGAAVLTGRDGRVLTFKSGLLAHKLAEGYSATGSQVQSCEVDLDAEVIRLPASDAPKIALDIFGLSSDEAPVVAQALGESWAANDPGKVEGREVDA